MKIKKQRVNIHMYGYITNLNENSKNKRTTIYVKISLLLYLNSIAFLCYPYIVLQTIKRLRFNIFSIFSIFNYVFKQNK